MKEKITSLIYCLAICFAILGCAPTSASAQLPLPTPPPLPLPTPPPLPLPTPTPIALPTPLPVPSPTPPSTPTPLVLVQTANLSGTVTGFIAATAATPGSITIGGLTLTIAPGALLNAVDANSIGANLNLSASLNALGQISSLNAIGAGLGAAVNVCGVVSSMTAATAMAPGVVVVSGVPIPIAAGTTLNGAASSVLGANLCLAGNLNAAGQLTLPNSLTANVNATANVCGIVSSLTQATASLPGSLTIGGVTLQTAPNTILGGLGVGANLCLTGNLNALGQINGLNSITTNIGMNLNICGVVTALTNATATLPGSITIGGQTLTIAPGTILNGQGLLALGAEVCLTAVVTPPGTPPGGPVITGGQVTVGLSCQSPQLIVPLATNGFTKTAVFKDGDLFLLPQSLALTLVPPSPAGLSVFPVNFDTFDGNAADIGGFPETNLQGIALSNPNATAQAVSCSESFRAINFELASAGATTGDVVRFFLQQPDGSRVQDLALFTVQANGVVVTQLNTNVTLFRNNRLGSGPGRLNVGAFTWFSMPAGSSGLRTDLLTLGFVRSPSSPLNGCVQLVASITHGSGVGTTSMVITDILVNRNPLPADPSNPGFGLLGGLGGGYPTGLPCMTVCPACPLSTGTQK